MLAMKYHVYNFAFLLVAVNAFSTINMRRRYAKKLFKSSPVSIISTPSTTTRIFNTLPERGYPVQIIHHGHSTLINVREDEPILQALERQSIIADNGNQLSLALSNVPHECRRGNCLTCASKIVQQPSDAATDNEQQNNNLIANVDNGLSPTVSSELTNSGYVLTCCSYVKGPGVALELDQNNEVWDVVYRQRLCDGDTKQVALEAQARLLRRVDEENVEKWKYKTEKVLSEKK